MATMTYHMIRSGSAERGLVGGLVAYCGRTQFSDFGMVAAGGGYTYISPATRCLDTMGVELLGD